MALHSQHVSTISDSSICYPDCVRGSWWCLTFIHQLTFQIADLTLLFAVSNRSCLHNHNDNGLFVWQLYGVRAEHPTIECKLAGCDSIVVQIGVRFSIRAYLSIEVLRMHKFHSQSLDGAGYCSILFFIFPYYHYCSFFYG